MPWPTGVKKFWSFFRGWCYVLKDQRSFLNVIKVLLTCNFIYVLLCCSPPPASCIHSKNISLHIFQMNEFNFDINPILVFYECRSSCQKGPHFLEVQQILDEKLFHCKFMLNKHYFSQTQTKLSSLLWQICTICMHSCLNIVNTFYKSNEHITKIIKVVKEKKVQKHVSYSYP